MVKIYYFYDYFPLVFILLAVSSILDDHKIISSLSFILSFGVIFFHSRFFTVAVFLFYVLYFLRLYGFSFAVIYLGMLMLISSIIFAVVVFSVTSHDLSFFERFYHWQAFFGSFTAFDLFPPFLNDYRAGLVGSFHNELLDFYSYFGILILPILYVVFRAFANVALPASRGVKIFLAVLLAGLLIQNNFSHLWSGILIFYLLGSLAGCKAVSKRDFIMIKREMHSAS